MITKPLWIESQRTWSSTIRLRLREAFANESSTQMGTRWRATAWIAPRCCAAIQIEEAIRLQSPNRRPGRGLDARPVRLRFLLKDADLYSIKFAN